MNVYKGAVMKAAAIKLFVGKIYVLKKKPVCTKTHYFVVSCNVIVNILFDFSRVGNVVEAVAFFFCKVAVCIKCRKCIVTAVSYKTRIFCKHISFIL